MILKVPTNPNYFMILPKLGVFRREGGFNQQVLKLHFL